MSAPSLTEALAAAGYAIAVVPGVLGKRRITRIADGEEIGVMSAHEAWEWLHEQEKGSNA